MSARLVHGLMLDGEELRNAAYAVELLVNAMRERARREGAAVSRDLLALLERMREACSMSCAAQPAQLAREVAREEWQPTDLITVKEAAELMKCSKSNVRARCGRESLWSVKVGGQYRLSRADVLAAPSRKAS